MTVVLETTGLMKSFGGVQVIDDLSVQAARGRSAGHRRAERRRQDHVVQSDHRRVSARRGPGHVQGQGHHAVSRGTIAAAQGIGRTFQIPKPFGGHERVRERARLRRLRAQHERARELRALRGDARAHAAVAPRPTSRRARCRCSTASGSSWPARSPATPTSCCWTRSPAGSPRPRSRSSSRPIKDLHREGISIIWIEHIVHALLAVVQRIVAISFGRNLIEGDPNEVMCSDEVQACYMGGTPL